ncbi:MAG: TrmJ/YjtD family RNA methyltransferase [Proteobacteria bacterium]|nr:TrmJ/YjtD family RNA methyltransferase [Pseudomonadota bacterium]
MKRLDLFKIILVEPQNPINVGNVMRAMKNMGLSKLALVNPADMDLSRTQISAHRTEDLLNHIEIFSTLDEALTGIHESYGFSARKRTQTWASLDMESAVSRSLALAEQDLAIAFVFGREQSGLTNEELARCSCRVHIETSDYTSLNLAQAVLLAAYELLRQARTPGNRVQNATPLENHAPNTRPATQDEMFRLLKTLESALVEIGYYKSPDPNTAIHRVHNLLTRADLHNDEYHLLMGMAKEISNYAALMEKNIPIRKIRPAKSFGED